MYVTDVSIRNIYLVSEMIDRAYVAPFRIDGSSEDRFEENDVKDLGRDLGDLNRQYEFYAKHASDLRDGIFDRSAIKVYSSVSISETVLPRYDLRFKRDGIPAFCGVIHLAERGITPLEYVGVAFTGIRWNEKMITEYMKSFMRDRIMVNVSLWDKL
jgi:hypothetical protein